MRGEGAEGGEVETGRKCERDVGARDAREYGTLHYKYYCFRSRLAWISTDNNCPNASSLDAPAGPRHEFARVP